MSQAPIAQIFERFAKSFGLSVCDDQLRQSVKYVDLESTELDQGYLRLCLDSMDHIVIVETVISMVSIFSNSTEVLQKLMTFHLMASPSKTGKRFFPSVDLQNENLILSYIIGSEAIFNELDLAALAEACVSEVVSMRKNLKEILNNPSVKPKSAGGHERLQTAYLQNRMTGRKIN